MREQLLYCPEYDFIAILGINYGQENIISVGSDDTKKLAKLLDDATWSDEAPVDLTDFIWLGDI